MAQDVVIIGGGFVGLNEAALFARKGYRVHIIDINEKVIESINSGEEDRLHIREKYIIDNWKYVKENISATDDYSVIEDSNIILIAVNTPLKVYKEELIEGLQENKDIEYFIDFTPIKRAINELKKFLQPDSYINSLVTMFPNGTNSFIIKPLKEAGYELGKDIFITHTPERVDPGNKHNNPENTPRNLGYYDENSLRKGLEIYRNLVSSVTYEKMEVVELSKLHENAFRLLNIAFVQKSLIKLGKEIFKVIDLAGNKPFGFLKFYPSPYAGGTCLVKDSIMYWYVTKNDLIKEALIINETMPKEYAKLLYDKIKHKRRILFWGFGFKPNSPYYISKHLNPIERLIEELKKLDSSLDIRKYDPNIPDKSDFVDGEEAKRWADIVLYWDYTKLLNDG
ncbi:3-hydroxyacyl-CoA dehydrogenase NAD-binding domain-containing protein [Pyrococcus kukulkanii]|uniref:3-hydroxyacyl-CoA dehydrogenase NAD-binding domain-containing protein n=1 Tax=Pyrococcus kukulkanii TaxID=1609559 RepID=UPI00356273F3